MGNEPAALRYAAASHGGKGRSGIEDAAYAGPHLLVIADGFESMSSPDSAARMAIEELGRHDAVMDAADLAASVERSMADLGETFRELVRNDPRWTSTGTSLTAMLWRDTHAAIAHIGNTRAYMLRGGELTQLTSDHTPAQLVLEGKLGPDAFDPRSMHSILFRALAGNMDATADITVHEAALGDRYVLSTDGVHSIISFENLRNIILDTAREPHDVVDDIVRETRPIKHYDDFSCIVADVVNPSSASAQPITLWPY